MNSLLCEYEVRGWGRGRGEGEKREGGRIGWRIGLQIAHTDIFLINDRAKFLYLCRIQSRDTTLVAFTQQIQVISHSLPLTTHKTNTS